MKKSTVLKICGVILVLAGIIFIAFPFAQIAYDKYKISQNISQWDKDRAKLINQEKDGDKNLKDFHYIEINGHKVIGKLITMSGHEIPIIEGASEATLADGAALYNNGVLPGDKHGTVVILGHREVTFGFLENIKIGDIVEIQTINNVYKYKAVHTYITDPNDPSILEQKEKPSLTLVTCYPFTYVGPAPERFIVNFEQIK